MEVTDLANICCMEDILTSHTTHDRTPQIENVKVRYTIITT